MKYTRPEFETPGECDYWACRRELLFDHRQEVDHFINAFEAVRVNPQAGQGIRIPDGEIEDVDKCVITKDVVENGSEPIYIEDRKSA